MSAPFSREVPSEMLLSHTVTIFRTDGLKKARAIGMQVRPWVRSHGFVQQGRTCWLDVVWFPCSTSRQVAEGGAVSLQYTPSGGVVG